MTSIMRSTSSADLTRSRGQPVAVLGLARSGVALTRFLHDRGAQVTVYDARPSAELGPQIDQLERRDVRLLLGPDVEPGDGPCRPGAHRHVALDQQPLPDDRAAAAPGAGRRRSRRHACRSCQRGRPVPAALPGDDHRRHRHEGQDDHELADRGGAVAQARRRSCWAATSACRWSSACPS